MRVSIIRVLVLACAVTALLSQTALAHIFENVGGQYVYWYFDGTVYHDKGVPHTPDNIHATDPIQIDFQGGTPNGPECQSGNVGDATITEGCLRARIPDTWLHNNKICANEDLVLAKAYMVFRDENGIDSAAGDSFELYSARPNKIGPHYDPCRAGFHIRFWDDSKHADVTGANHAFRNMWQIGAIHHEHRVGSQHRIDMDWDNARVIFFKRVGVNWCGKRRWRVHPQAIGKWSGFENSGMLSRIPIAHSPTSPCSDL